MNQQAYGMEVLILGVILQYIFSASLAVSYRVYRVNILGVIYISIMVSASLSYFNGP